MSEHVGSLRRKAPLLPAAALLRRTTRLPLRSRNSQAFILSPNSGRGGQVTPTPESGSSAQSRGSKMGELSSRAARSARGSWHSRVSFAPPELNTMHEITPYEEFYGKHPNNFNFDAFGNMIPPSPAGFSSPCAPTSPSEAVPATPVDSCSGSSPMSWTALEAKSPRSGGCTTRNRWLGLPMPAFETSGSPVFMPAFQSGSPQPPRSTGAAPEGQKSPEHRSLTLPIPEGHSFPSTPPAFPNSSGNCSNSYNSSGGAAATVGGGLAGSHRDSESCFAAHHFGEFASAAAAQGAPYTFILDPTIA